MNMGKVVIVTEETAQAYVDSILAEAFVPAADKVREVKEYLDKNFKNARLYNMTPKEILLRVENNFPHVIEDETDRRKFLKQIIKDWYSGKLKDDGVLSVNMIQ